ncbi:hypothetical protein SASPL_156940 [Salvia splendens]|uniref:Pentatricopeptide repeat-containing protein n=1 Tax=Salvia splendens TaxID=180675 RepID=A0A8X8VVT3_SALSN|nr:hypothetical protein SASPL_156940 [Salvia splendens]
MPFRHSPPAVLSLLKTCKTLRDLNQIHAHIIHRGCEQDHYLIAHFLIICTAAQPANVRYPTTAFNCVISPNIYLWNILIKIHCENGPLGGCFSLFRRMRKGGNVGDVFMGSNLIDFYGKCREIESAWKVFDGMCVRNEVSWTAMMVRCLDCGDMDAARKMFDEMPKKNDATWNTMIKGLVRLGDLVNARKVFDEMPVRDAVSFTTLISGYAKAGDMAAARFMFDQMDSKDLVSWSAIMSGYVQNGKPVILMSACAQLGSSELARWIESYMHEGPYDTTRPHVAAALVDMNAKCGDMAKLFEEMPRRHLVSYCSMIQGLCIHGRGAEAVALFHRMIDEGVRPDDVAFTVILTTCSHAGLVDEGCRVFDLMTEKYSMSPSPDHYACMVNLLGKSGRVKAAYELMTFEMGTNLR